MAENTNRPNMGAEDMEKIITQDMNNFFDNFLKPGIVIKEEDVAPGFRVKLRALDTGELISAESVILSMNPNVHPDITQKVKAASILSKAIIELNGMPIEQDNLSEEHNLIRRHNLYRQILKMPPILITKTYELYIEAVNEQTNIYTNVDKLDSTIENFSERRSEI